MTKLLLLLIATVLAGFVAWFMESRGANAQITAVVATGIPTLLLPLYELVEAAGKTRSTRVRELMIPTSRMSPLVVFIYVLMAFQFLQRAMGGIVGGAIGSIIPKGLPYGVFLEIFKQFSPAISQVVQILSIPIALLLGKHLGHNIVRYPEAWAAFSMIVTQVINVLFLYLTLPDFLPEDGVVWILYFGVTVVYVAAAVIGCRWAKRTDLEYRMRRLYKQLSQTDKKALLELVVGLPDILSETQLSSKETSNHRLQTDR